MYCILAQQVGMMLVSDLGHFFIVHKHFIKTVKLVEM